MILSRIRAATAAVVATTMPLLGACADSSTTPGDDRPVIVATTTIWADVTSEVACGEPVRALIPTGADPHTFEPSLRDRELIERADVIIANGLGLEDALADLLASSSGEIVEVTSGVETISDDPHVWQDPELVIATLTSIGRAVRSLGFDDCSDEYRGELEALDAEITALIAPIPKSDRVMVTSHDSLRYFADRYGLEVVGTVIPSTSTLAETNAADLADLAELIEARGVRAIYTEQLESSADADALARRLGVDVVPLVTDALTDDPESDSYIEMMRSNATSIVTALTP